MNYLRFFILYFVTMYIYIYICNDFKIFIFYSDLLKYCKALSTEKYKRYINILLFIIIILSISICPSVHETIHFIELTRV